RWAVDGHWVQLAVSDRGMGLRSWQDAAGETWATWAAGSWLDLLVEVA
ncbi:MAG: hypothetical protein RLZ55_1789, partial [Actinomycetota bacterium]